MYVYCKCFVCDVCHSNGNLNRKVFFYSLIVHFSRRAVLVDDTVLFYFILVFIYFGQSSIAQKLVIISSTTINDYIEKRPFLCGECVFLKFVE